MKAFYYCLTNTTNNRRYHGSTLEVSFRVGEHFQKLKNNKHSLRTLQEDFNLGHQFQVTYELLDKDKAIQKESIEISQDPNSYNLRNVPPPFKNKEKENQLFFSLEDYYNIWYMLKNYNSVEFLRLKYGLPSRREVYKIYYFVEYGLPYKKIKPIATHLPPRNNDLENWERVYNDEIKRIEALAIMEFLPRSRQTVTSFMGSPNTRYFHTIASDPKRWPEEKKEYYQNNENERKQMFISIMIENDLFNLWLSINKISYTFKDILAVYLFNEVTISSIKNSERSSVISPAGISRSSHMSHSKLSAFIIQLAKDGFLNAELYKIYTEMLEKCPTVLEKHKVAKLYMENPNIEPAEILQRTKVPRKYYKSVKEKQSLLNFLKEMPQHILSALPAG